MVAKLVLELETMYKTRDQDNTEIFSCVREKLLSYMREKFKLCDRKTFKLCERNNLSFVRGETFKSCEKKF